MSPAARVSRHLPSLLLWAGMAACLSGLLFHRMWDTLPFPRFFEHLLLAGLAVAARHGFEMENGVQYARDRYVDVNIFDDRNREVLERLSQLPASCEESARRLSEQRAVYERYGVFPPRLIDGLVDRLASFRDAHLREELGGDESKIKALVDTSFYCG